MLNIDSGGKFFVRIKEYPAFPDVEGQIVYIRSVSRDGLEISFTDDCRPMNKVYQLPAVANDNGWYDITSLILKANTVILPKYSKCVFASNIASGYRNFLDKIPAPYEERDSIGRLCFLGTMNGRNVKFSKMAYYIVAIDDNGYILAYAGFCQFLDEWERPQILQRILRIVGTNRKMFPAEFIVNACNKAYEEDTSRAQDYAKTIQDTVAASSVDTDVNSTVYHSGISKLQLT